MASTDYRHMYYKKMYDKRVAEGLCVYCGKVDALPGRRYCTACHIRRAKNAENAKRRNENGIPEKWPTGWCYVCGDEAPKGRKLCEKHRYSLLTR